VNKYGGWAKLFIIIIITVGGEKNYPKKNKNKKKINRCSCMHVL
jgi:hypothetical protein